MADVKQQLKKVQCDGMVFYQKLRHFHWIVKGQRFFELHEKFEEFYTEWAQWVDDVAERILQLGDIPVPTLKAALETSSLKETGEILKDQDIMKAIVDDMRAQREQAIAVKKAAGDSDDVTTENLMDDFIDSTAKHLWMCESWLAK